MDRHLFDCRVLHHSKVALGRQEHLPKGIVPPLVTIQEDKVQLGSQYQANGVASDTIILL
jgi:hypothetical protein